VPRERSAAPKTAATWSGIGATSAASYAAAPQNPVFGILTASVPPRAASKRAERTPPSCAERDLGSALSQPLELWQMVRPRDVTHADDAARRKIA